MFLSTGIAFLLGTTSFPGEAAASPKAVVEIAAGYRVINRKLEPVETDNVFVASDMVVVWTALAGVPAGFIEHVWRLNGVEVARHYLPVGSDRRWRTWSRQRVDPGEYEVSVLGPDGAFLGKTTFIVAAEVDDDC